MTGTVRVLLVDDDPMVRRAFRMILATAPDLEVVAEASDGHEVVGAVQAHRPDVVVMDLRMPLRDGVLATQDVTALPDPPTVLAVTSFSSDRQVLAALSAGAEGFLLKDSSPEEIVAAIRAVARGGGALSPSVSAYVIDQVRTAPDPRQDAARAALDTLTERQRAIAEGVHAGATNEEIGAQLFLSAATVKTHLSEALLRTGAANRVALAVLVEQARARR
ncbi:DNA-binding response regulator [Flavimobilis marinus]|uniref:Two component transcriptional regulator, LuxR family n=1 Tax=Flavimobilis marinus TaxID=285351 RepID=A0A1I2DRD2_9MICO|nr:response regulator transcription factor [Flavimobilis marinus]GHG44573.1 DNA-binding response regulator [Flavimobilis marinus]SFE82863.1 two component transcriptional regulator, LuxR family [Flavimobilis marinus]